MTYLEEYFDLVQRNEIRAGHYLKKALRNLIRDLDRYTYDTREAEKRIRFMQTMCLQSKAPYYMKPMVLDIWQKAFIEALYSFKLPDGKRRFIEALMLIARKNGKSTLLAADATCDLFIGPSGSDICCASNDDKQAKIIWEEVGKFRAKLDPKKSLTGQNLTIITNKQRTISVVRMSSKTQNKDGFNFSKVYLDESHDIDEENGKSEIAEACWRSMSAREEPLFINSTTQGFNRDCYLDKKIEKAKKVIDGEIEDERFLAFLFEQDSEQEIWQDPTSWEKSNPGLRSGIKKRLKLERDVEDAKNDSATRIHLLTKDFNIPQNAASSWLQNANVNIEYKQEPIDLEQWRGWVYLGSVDLAETTDLASARIMMMRPGDKRKYFHQMYFIPETKLRDNPDIQAGAQYIEWARQGILTIHDGVEVDIGKVAEWFADLFRNYKLKPLNIGYDQKFAEAFLSRCEEYGFGTTMLLQGKYLSGAMKLTEEDLRHQNLQFSENPIDKWCLKNTCVMTSNTGEIQPVKVKGQPAMKIDGTLTMIMCEEMLRRNRSDYNEIIEQLGG